ncbi:hypothetical protein L0F63_001191, partial [Massospora cicadina]
MSLAPPPATPVWGSSRVQMGSNSPPTASNRFVPPWDLALHLARVHPSRPHPLALPRSRVDYGRLFPYADKEIIDLATVAFAPDFIDFRPFKGYFDVGFQSEEDAEAATLYDQLVAGLMAYGTQPNLIFAIPSGADCGGLSSLPKTMHRGGPVSGSAAEYVSRLFDDAEVAVMNVTMIASFNPSAKITHHSISLFTQLPEARKEAEVLLAAFVETLSCHYLDAEEENSYY